MPHSYEEKLKAVKLVTEKQYSYLQAGRSVGASKTTVMSWVQRAAENGFDALQDREKKNHTGEYKVHVVEYMHEHHMSAYAAAAHFDLCRSQIQRWERIYYEEGVAALLVDRRGRSKIGMPRKKKTQEELAAEQDIIAELQYLRMENEYLKKLNALVQSRKEQPLKKKYKSSMN